MLHHQSASFASSAESGGGADRGQGHAHTVLVVDADASGRESLRFLLTAEGFVVAVADGVAAATRLLTEMAFEVVITDLPAAGGGSAWVHFVRSVQPAAAVVVVSADDVTGAPLRSVRGEVFAWLAKPVPLEELLSVLARATAASRDRRGPGR